MADIQDLPVVLAGLIDANTITVTQTYDNVSSIYHGSPYYFSVDISILPLLNSDDTITPNPYQYDANHIEPGMWIAEQSGKAFLIVSVEVVDQENVTATLKDVNLFNLLSDYTFAGNNMPAGGSYGIIFKLSEDGIPIIPFVYSNYLGNVQDSSYWVATDVITRFQYRNLLKSHYNNSTSPNANYANYEVGQMVYLDSDGVFQLLDASDATHVKKRFGVITSVNEPEEGDLGVRPWGKVVGDLDLGAFTVGDALYYDGTVGAPFLTATEPASSAIPMYIKISDTTGMYITDMVGGGDQIYNSQFSNPAETVFTVGGVDAGTPVGDLDGQTISQVLDQIFFPPTCPTPVQPSTGFSDSPDVVNSSITSSYLYLVGDTLNSTFSFTASPGSVPDQGDFAGPIVSATLTLPDNTNVDVHSGSGFTMNNYNLTNYEVPLGIQNWQYSVVFGDGPAVLDSYGDPNCPSYSQDTKTINRKLEGVYPVFAGTSATYTQGAVSDTWDSSMDPLTGNSSWSSVALFSFENLSSKEIYQGYGESDNTATWVNHRFAVPNALGLSAIQVDGGTLGWQNATSTFDVIGGLTLTINGQSVGYTIYERVNSDAGGANNYRLVW